MTERGVFGPQDYNDDGILRVGWLLWLILAYLTRHWLLLVLGAVTEWVGRRSSAIPNADGILYSNPEYLLASLPALALLVAAARRRPGAGKLVRAIWRQGRRLLFLSALGELIFLAVSGHGRWASFTELHVVGALLDLYILAYLLRSRRLTQRFEDFPSST